MQLLQRGLQHQGQWPGESLQPEWRDRPTIREVLPTEQNTGSQENRRSRRRLRTLGLSRGTGDESPGAGKATDQPAERGEWR